MRKNRDVDCAGHALFNYSMTKVNLVTTAATAAAA